MKKILLLLTLSISFLFSFNNNLTCNQNIDKKVIQICYNYTVKGPIVVKYNVSKEQVNTLNIKKRPKFYKEKNLKSKYRTTYADYTHSTSLYDLENREKVIHYDRGHLAPDASFDYDLKDLRKVYTMANIIPQVSEVNRRTWIKSEKLERIVAQKQNITVIVLVEYGNLSNYLVKIPLDKLDTSTWTKNRINKYLSKSKKLLNKKIVVPTGFYKILLSEDTNYKEVLYYKNIPTDTKKDKLKDHRISKNERNEIFTYLKKIGI